MGCCVSTNNTPLKSARKHTSKSPPQTSEKVKEVLSETPSENIPPFLENHTSSTLINLLIHEVSKTTPDEAKQRDGDVFKKSYMVPDKEKQPQECSKICGTVSESVSPSKKVTEEKEQKGPRSNNVSEIRQSNSPARVRNEALAAAGRRDKIIGRCTGRISNPSPDRVRPVSAYGSWSIKNSNGDSTGSWKRSPAISTHSVSSNNGMVRSQYEKKMSRSPGRAGSVSGGRISKLDRGENIGEDQWPTRSGESLENPLISLECFIFL